MVRDEILLGRCVNPKKVNLPDGQTFYARYERVGRRNLPTKVTIKKTEDNRTKTQAERKQQHGSGFLGTVFNIGKKLFKPSYITKAFNIGSKAANLAIRQKIIEEGIEKTPAIYNAGVKRIKNKKMKNILELDLANYAVKKAQKHFYN